MANFTEADETTLTNFATGMNGPLQDLEKNLSRLGGSQNTLQTAFVGQAGTAVENAFANVLDTGRNVALKIEEIMGMIHKSAAEFTSRDGEALQALISGMGEAYTDGKVETGGTGSWNDGAVDQRVDPMNPTKAKTDWF
ncbi:hypothetical protein HGA13_17050 [Nocardia speluncae]|uniref:Uncharacterized protein n=1 Tax=Nocardia speluncae TaxID=419477 RepID=A0A846XHT0_9NOCA|nr:hypothetical protein [Nocardia speluncae]NKY34769.1 hypothetical protein [Nocardia speluncae]